MQRENRRLAAIVAANVAGYSRLIGQDEEGALRALRLHRKDLIDRLIEEHGGRIANTAGNSLLLEFPSAVDAVRCAVAMQDGMAARNQDIEEGRQIRFRVGIHVGDVVAQRIDQAIRRNPHYPSFYGSILARIHYLEGADDDALTVLNMADTLTIVDHVVFAGSYAQLGRLDEARRRVAQILAIDPDFRISD